MPSSHSPTWATLRWPWILLGASLIWMVVLRLPLLLNTSTHIDSDFAIDGLTLRDAIQGHWRWHFPGTPHIGTASIAIMLPIAIVSGKTTLTLGLGAIFISALVVISTFLLGWHVFGPRVAAWSLIPLSFASTGQIWLSGRVTGGHLLAVAWHAAAFLGLYVVLKKGGMARAAGLGLWCGLGLWNDSMFLVTIAGMTIVGSLAWIRAGGSRAGFISGSIMVVGLWVGLLPKFIGKQVDPYDAYHETFGTDYRVEVLFGHLKILALDCLPRLIVGHRLPNLEAEPGGISLDGRVKPASASIGIVPLIVVILGLGLFMIAGSGLTSDRSADPEHATWALRWGLILTSIAVIAGFVINRNIFNSDNYRYLVFLLVPWSIGFGRFMDWLWNKEQGGVITAALIGLLFALMFTLDTANWYRQLGWLDSNGWPVSRTLDDPMLDWLNTHPEITQLYGDYWDVYRLSELTSGRVKGIPSTHYPNRFPEQSLTGFSRQTATLVRPTPIGEQIRFQAVKAGSEERFRSTTGLILTGRQE